MDRVLTFYSTATINLLHYSKLCFILYKKLTLGLKAPFPFLINSVNVKKELPSEDFIDTITTTRTIENTVNLLTMITVTLGSTLLLWRCVLVFYLI